MTKFTESLGLKDPEVVKPRRRSTVDYTRPAVEQRQRDAAAARAKKAANGADRDDDEPVVPDFSDWPDGNLAGYFEAEPPAVQWFCDERLLAGRGHLLAGAGGSSKTRVLYHLGVGAVTGKLPWTWPVSVTGTAALFLTEDVAAQVHRVVHFMGQKLGTDARRLLVERLRVFPLAGKHVRLLELNRSTLRVGAVYGWMMSRIDALAQVAPVAFVGIDPALAVTEGDEMLPAHQRRLGELVDHVAIETGACTMLSAHTAKGTANAEELSSHTSRGSGAITDAVRAEFAVRTMTTVEAAKFGITDRAVRQSYLQLAATKGNELPPEAYVPVWLQRSAGGVSEVTLEEVEGGTVGARETKAYQLLCAKAAGGDTSTRFWRAECEAAGLISPTLTDDGKERAMSRMRAALVKAGLVEQGFQRGLWKPKSSE